MAQSRLILASSAAWALGLVVGLGGVVVGCGNSGNNADAGSGVGGATGAGGGSVTGTGGGSVTGTGGGSVTGTGGAAIGVGGVSGTAGSTGTAGATGTGGRGTGGSADAGAQPDTGGNSMSFFVTSTGSGTMGGNLNGVAGADAKCQALAAAVGQGGKTWHAYLSTSTPVLNARTRVGNGPWYNARGVMIAASVAQLHDEAGMNALSAANSLDENGAMVPNNQHDMLTGSTTAGMAFPATPDRTCAGWTSNATTGVAVQVGHCNRAGGGDIPTSWNSAHAPANCSQATLISVGGAGRFYCFAIN